MNRTVRRRPRKSLADYLVVGVSPVLIMCLVGSFVFFLIRVFYQGEFQGRLTFIFAMFVMATVLVARISMEEGREYAAMFAVPLAIVTMIALMRFVRVDGGMILVSWLFNWTLMAVVWWLSHRLTFDCTLIDENEDSTDAGLLQSLGWDGETPVESRDARPLESVPQEQPEATDQADHATGNLWQRWIARQRVPHAPGVWIIYFSLVALPVFGIAQGLLPAADLESRRYTFRMICLYMASGLGLLMTTSFLGLRRYLRQRRIAMPARMAVTWVAAGSGLILLLLALCSVIPRPRAEFTIARLPFTLTSPDNLKPSRFSTGEEGVEVERGGAAGGSQESESGGPSGRSSRSGGSGSGDAEQGSGERSGERGSASDGSSSRNGESRDNASSESSSGNEGERGSQGESSGSSDESGRSDSGERDDGTGGRQGSEDSGSESSGESSRGDEDGGGDPAGERDASERNSDGSDDGSRSEGGGDREQSGSQDANGRGDERSEEGDGDSGEEGQSRGKRFSGEGSSRSGAGRRAQDSRSSEAERRSPTPSRFLSGVGTVLKWIIYIVVLAVAAFFAWRYREQIREAVLRFWAELKQWWNDLWNRGDSEEEAVGDEASEKRSSGPPFRAFPNPFQTKHGDRSPDELVRYTFEALEAWGRENGCPRQADQTPLEFAAALRDRCPDLGRDPRRLADWYGALAYAGASVPASSLPYLERLWQRMQALDSPSLPAGHLEVAGTAGENGGPATG